MVLEALLSPLRAMDDAGVEHLNAVVRASPTFRAVIGLAARRLSLVEVLLMVALAVSGRRTSALRIVAAVGVVYLLSEAGGALWPRRRPFARLRPVEALVSHAAARSFPSRHVASGLAMASIGRRAHPRLGLTMTLVAGALGFSRIAAGLHYPSDVLGGAIMGLIVGRSFRPGRYGHRV